MAADSLSQKGFGKYSTSYETALVLFQTIIYSENISHNKRES